MAGANGAPMSQASDPATRFDPTTTGRTHTLFEDAQAILTGALFVALGVVTLKHAGLLTGGTAGLAFLVHYATGWSFGAVFFVLNLPFYGLAAATMGRPFMLKTFAAVGALSVASEWIPSALVFERLDPLFAAVMGGFLVGAGLLMLFRHRASLGGINVLALYLQDRHGLRAGTVQMAIDCLIVLAALAVVDLRSIVLSLLGAVALNLVVAVNHRPGRYLGV
jgi:uncharacterized membrane-anchored protein YitT (DUF2179 family)